MRCTGRRAARFAFRWVLVAVLLILATTCAGVEGKKKKKTKAESPPPSRYNANAVERTSTETTKTLNKINNNLKELHRKGSCYGFPTDNTNFKFSASGTYKITKASKSCEITLTYGGWGNIKKEKRHQAIKDYLCTEDTLLNKCYYGNKPQIWLQKGDVKEGVTCDGAEKCTDCVEAVQWDDDSCTATCGAGEKSGKWKIETYPSGDGAKQCSHEAESEDKTACTAECDPPTVTMNNNVHASSRVLDLDVKVSHEKACVSNDCSEDDAIVSCDVTVARDGVECRNNFGDYLPCKKWDDFRDSNVDAGEDRVLGLTTNGAGDFNPGTYAITYKCRIQGNLDKEWGDYGNPVTKKFTISDEVDVVVRNPVRRVTAYAYDFGIVAKHALCENPEDCLAVDQGSRAKNVECTATVSLTKNLDGTSHACTTYGDSLPCLSWENFLPKVLPMTDAHGNMAPSGTYVIEYSCGFGTAPPIKTKLHEFELSAGCEPIISNDAENTALARMFFYGSDAFANPSSCDPYALHSIKETLFRRFDVNPTDGTLDYDELVAAFIAHGVDAGALRRWNEQGQLSLKIAQALSVPIKPIDCPQTEMNGNVLLTSTVYPKSGKTSSRQCESGAFAMRASMTHGGRDVASGDFTCVYIDGILFDKMDVRHAVNGKIQENAYTEVSDGVYVGAHVVDARPVSGGFKDSELSLVAHFTFDDAHVDKVAKGSNFMSSAPLVPGQRLPSALTVESDVVSVEPCSASAGRRCLKIKKHASKAGLRYSGDAITEHVSLSTWTRDTGVVARFSGRDGGGCVHALELRVDKSSAQCSAVVSYTLTCGNSDTSDEMSNSSVIEFVCKEDNFVGFAYHPLDGVTVFANPESDEDTYFKSLHDWPRSGSTMKLSKMPDITFFPSDEDIDKEYDDLRVFTGRVSRATFVDSYTCGHHAFCGGRVHASPSSRRIVCVSAFLESEGATAASAFSCGAAMYYTGAPIDVTASLETVGVVFAFRDTSWDESSFEVVRRPGGDDTVDYESIVIISGALSACGSTFNSISYVDAKAGLVPNAEWVYAVRVKSPSLGDLASKPFHFRTPFHAKASGTINTAGAPVGVKDVRVCASWTRLLASPPGSTNIAFHSRATLSNTSTQDALRTYVLTDGDLKPNAASIAVRRNEYVRVSLEKWSVVKHVVVCVAGDVAAARSAPFGVYVQERATVDSGAHGNACHPSTTAPASESNCFVFACSGTSVRALRGEFVSVVAATEDAPRVTEIRVLGSDAGCDQSALTDENGDYDFLVVSMDERTASKRKIFMTAYKEEISPRNPGVTLLDTSQSEDDASVPVATLRVIRRAHSTSPTIVADSHERMNRTEFIQYMRNATRVGAASNTSDYVIIPEDIWGDDASNKSYSLADVVVYSVHEFVVFRPVSVRNMYDIDVSAHASSNDARCDEGVALFHRKGGISPSNETAWRAFYDEELSAVSKSQAFVDGCSSSREAVRFGNESLAYVTPVFVGRTTPVLNQDANANRATAPPFFIKATQWSPDIIHDFNVSASSVKANEGGALDPTNSEDTASMGSARGVRASARLGTQGDEGDEVMAAQVVQTEQNGVIAFSPIDTSTVIVSGAVLLPSSRTAGSTRCGLYSATVQASEDKGASVPENESRPQTTQTDESGWFEFSLTNGKTYTITAYYTPGQDVNSQDDSTNHKIYYTGETIASATGYTTADCVKDDTRVTTVTITLNTSHYVFFSDVTQTYIELGVFAGECDEKYAGTTFRVTPINGCHKPQYVSASDIEVWTDKQWPFAPLDYSIMLASGPSFSDEIASPDPKGEWWTEGCATEPGDMVEYFRSRDALERLALMGTEVSTKEPPGGESNGPIEVKYKYHGYVCVDIVDGDRQDTIPKINDTTSVCYTDPAGKGELQEQHLLGDTWQGPRVKNIAVRVFELHATSGAYKVCPNVSGSDGLSTKIEFRQDVTDELANECHPNRGGHSNCDFEIKDTIECSDKPGCIKWTTDERDDVSDDPHIKKVAGTAINLVGNHRRSITATVHRLDGARTVTASLTRQLVPLNRKARGGSGLSDGTFWATVPIEGLVYTVVHDPPGGNSYAEIAAGAEISMKYETTNVRRSQATFHSLVGAGVKAMWEKSGSACTYSVVSGFCTKSTLEMELGEQAAYTYEHTGPNPSVTMTVEDGWDITATVNRIIRTSEDPGIPGRNGDVILGGGLELVYTLSDYLDVVAHEDGKKCLQIDQEIMWGPSKPTSYVSTVHSIKTFTLPHLRYLYSTLLMKENKDESDEARWSGVLQQKIQAWERTLKFASPEIEQGKIPIWVSSLRGQYSLAGKNAALREADMESVFTVLPDEAVKELFSAWENDAGSDEDVKDWKWNERHLEFLLKKELDRKNHFGSYQDDEWEMPRFMRMFRESDDWYTETMSMFRESDDWYTGTGMSAEAVKDATGTMCPGLPGGCKSRAFPLPESHPIFEDTSARVDASFDGGHGGALEMYAANGVNTAPDDSDSDILLTFTGGGAATEYVYHSKDAVDGQDFSWSIEMEQENSHDAFIHGEIVIAQFDVGFGGSKMKTLTSDRVFGWGKYENVRTMYRLGDPDVGDKFVVQVKSDRRYGTPVFLVQGGRSKCPGELLTMFRESAVSLSVIPVKKTYLNPDENAVYTLKLTNESPYRERADVGLTLYDAVTESIQTIVSHALAEASITDSQHVLDAVTASVEASLASESTEVKKIVAAATKAKDEKLDDPWYVARVVANATQISRSAGSAMAGMTFRVNGREMVPFGEPLPFHAIAGESLASQAVVRDMDLTLTVSRAASSYAAEHIGVRLVSLCEYQMRNDLYRPVLDDVVSLGEMTWSKPCPSVAFDESTLVKNAENATASLQGSHTVSVNVINPNSDVLWTRTRTERGAVRSGLKYVRLQYRPVSGGEWISAKDENSEERDKKHNLHCDKSRLAGCKFDWDVNNKYEKLLSGFKDDAYEIRIKNFCVGGAALATPNVHEFVSEQRLSLRVDTVAPIPASMLVFPGASAGAQFYEEVRCDDATFDVYPKEELSCVDSSVVSREPVKVSEEDKQKYFDLRCFNSGGRGSVVVSPKRSLAQSKIDNGGVYDVEVSSVKDVANNVAGNFTLRLRVECWKELSTARLGAEDVDARDGRDRGKLPERATASHKRLGTQLALIAPLSVVVAALILNNRRATRDDKGVRRVTPLLAATKVAASTATYGSTV